MVPGRMRVVEHNPEVEHSRAVADNQASTYAPMGRDAIRVRKRRKRPTIKSWPIMQGVPRSGGPSCCPPLALRKEHKFCVIKS